MDPNIKVHASMTKAQMVEALMKEIEDREDEEVDTPQESWKKDQLLEFAVEYLGADAVITEPTEETRAAVAGSRASKPQRAHEDWTREELEAEAAKYSSRSEWNRKGKASHAAARAQGLLEEIFPAKKATGTRGPIPDRLTDELVIEKMQEYDNRTDFSHGARRYYYYARDHGLLDEYLPARRGGPKAAEEADQTEDNQVEGADEDGVEVEDA